MQNGEPKWLRWARELQAIAQSGLTFTKDSFDRERYERLRELSTEIFHSRTNESADAILNIFKSQTGYATPKIDVRGAVFNEDGYILMVRETADEGRWTLPGGWADVNITPAENVVKEVHEESGYRVRVVKLAAAWDRTKQQHPSGVFSCCKMFFVCEVESGTPSAGLETSEVRWFAEHELPKDLSLARVLPHQIERMFVHYRRPEEPSDYD